jgi:hypothetical protein
MLPLLMLPLLSGVATGLELRTVGAGEETFAAPVVGGVMDEALC